MLQEVAKDEFRFASSFDGLMANVVLKYEAHLPMKPPDILKKNLSRSVERTKELKQPASTADPPFLT